MVIERLIRESLAKLSASHTAREDVEWLLMYVLSLSRAQLYGRLQQSLPSTKQLLFQRLFRRRIQGEPISYLIGTQPFWSLSLRVTPAVLIPRPESELLVEQALVRGGQHDLICVADLGCGSGAVGLAIAHERPAWQITLVDNNDAALAVARENAQALGCEQVICQKGDWCIELPDHTFFLIVANPPYIAEGDPHLLAGDLRFEPQTALVAGSDGLAAIRQIIAQAGSHLVAGGWLLIEHGYDQQDRVAKLLQAQGYREIISYRDLAGIGRVTAGRQAICHTTINC